MTKKITYSCVGCGADVYSSADRKSEARCHKCRLNRDQEARRLRSNSSHLKKKMIEADGRICQDCGREDDVMLHHITSIKDGGKTTPDNCILLCEDCHRNRHGGRGVGIPKQNRSKGSDSDGL